ncbi:hypothetical protein DFA_11155 [Cavenderia fasciculata]|uniref:Yippee/Mis18/Cereblon domain-containing protein n=1 Tax=Cavenderia fasciculata TaxID=261658 RepID=F4QF35_CACFS|nr:uncharacterized protein DFA_11155 [Cavenderia fasciculata]EGG13394.1 hypothetical protein DFA_11155 [Cavenderia fasciculata]|eukprot:XP_004350098.1 hypothetical protein DFA_11155 [Cavenderia fasciculata]
MNTNIQEDHHGDGEDEYNDDEDYDDVDQSMDYQSPFKSPPPKFMRPSNNNNNNKIAATPTATASSSAIKTPVIRHHNNNNNTGGGGNHIDVSQFPLSTPSWTPKTTTSTNSTTSPMSPEMTTGSSNRSTSEIDEDATLSATPTFSTPGSSIFRSIDQDDDDDDKDNEDGEGEEGETTTTTPSQSAQSKQILSPVSPTSTSPYRQFKAPTITNLSAKKQQQPLNNNINNNNKLTGIKRKSITQLDNKNKVKSSNDISLDEFYQSIIIFKCIECDCIVGDSTMIIDTYTEEQERFMIDNHSYILSKIGLNIIIEKDNQLQLQQQQQLLLKCKQCNHIIGKIESSSGNSNSSSSSSSNNNNNSFIFYNNSLSLSLQESNRNQPNINLFLLPCTKSKDEYAHYLSFDYLDIYYHGNLEAAFKTFGAPKFGSYPIGAKTINVNTMDELDIAKMAMFYCDKFTIEGSDTLEIKRTKFSNFLKHQLVV